MISGDGIRNVPEGWWSVLTLDESRIDMLWLNEVALLVILAGATLAEAKDRFDGLERGEGLA